jgi:hypothetical protein
MSKREAKRYVRRLEAEFESAGFSGRGVTSDLSKKGVFIRTHKALAPGTPVTVRIHLSDGRVSVVKGIVKRSIKIPMYASDIKNGMGIEIIEMDDLFDELIKTFEQEKLTDNKDDKQDGREFIIITCPSCGVKNKVPASKISLGPRCGKCRASLMVN